MSEAKRYNSGKAKLGYFARSFHKALEAIARVKEFGATKYEEDNWKLGNKPDSEYLDSMTRHLDAFQQGEVYDADSGCHHLGHAIWNLCALFELNHNDVPVISKERFYTQMKHWADEKELQRLKETSNMSLDERREGEEFIVKVQSKPSDETCEKPNETSGDVAEGTDEVRCALDYFGNKHGPTDLPNHPYVDKNGVPLTSEQAERVRNQHEEVFKRVLKDVPYMGVGEETNADELDRLVLEEVRKRLQAKDPAIPWIQMAGDRDAQPTLTTDTKIQTKIQAKKWAEGAKKHIESQSVVGGGNKPSYVDGNGNPLTYEEALKMKADGKDIWNQVKVIEPKPDTHKGCRISSGECFLWVHDPESEPDEPMISHSYIGKLGEPLTPQEAYKRQRAGLYVQIKLHTLDPPRSPGTCDEECANPAPNPVTDNSNIQYFDKDGKSITRLEASGLQQRQQEFTYTYDKGSVTDE